MTEDNNEQQNKQSKVSFFPIQAVENDNWAGAVREFFKQLGAVSSLLIIALTFGQCAGFLDIYRLLDK